MIIGVSGLAGSGKDTAADHLVAKHNFAKVALADPLKRMCKDAFDFTDEQLWGPSEMRNAPDKRYLTPCPVCGGRPNEYELKHGEECTGPGFRYLTPRYALQKLGTEWGRDCFGDVWVRYALRMAQTIIEDQRYYDYDAKIGRIPLRGKWTLKLGVVIPDVRFKNEVDAIKEAGGKLVRVKRVLAARFEASPTEVTEKMSKEQWHLSGNEVLHSSLSGSAAAHRSETEQQSIPDSAFDYILDNSSDLPFLYSAIDRMVDEFKGKIQAWDPEQDADVPPFLRTSKNPIENIEKDCAQCGKKVTVTRRVKDVMILCPKCRAPTSPS